MMGKDLTFNKLLALLKEIHKEFPDLRFGQILQTALDKGKSKINADLHNYSSKYIFKALKEFQRETKHVRGILRPDESTPLKKYEDELLGIDGIGEKLTQDIITVYDSKKALKQAVKDDELLPFRDDIADKLKDTFGGKHGTENTD